MKCHYNGKKGFLTLLDSDPEIGCVNMDQSPLSESGSGPDQKTGSGSVGKTMNPDTTYLNCLRKKEKVSFMLYLSESE